MEPNDYFIVLSFPSSTTDISNFEEEYINNYLKVAEYHLSILFSCDHTLARSSLKVKLD